MRATAQIMTARPPAVQATASAIELGKFCRMAPLWATNQLPPMATQLRPKTSASAYAAMRPVSRARGGRVLVLSICGSMKYKKSGEGLDKIEVKLGVMHSRRRCIGGLTI